MDQYLLVLLFDQDFGLLDCLTGHSLGHAGFESYQFYCEIVRNLASGDQPSKKIQYFLLKTLIVSHGWLV